MNALTEVQTIRDAQGRAAFAVIPIAEYEALLARARATSVRDHNLIPNDVVNRMFEGDGASAIRAWREHLGLTQTELATRIGISQAAYAQTEAAARPRKATLERVATALGITVAQLAV